MKGISNIKLFILDVDGVLTDGSIIYDSEGRELKAFNVKDGLGLVLLRKLGIKLAIITGRRSSIVEKRAKELGIDFVYQGVFNKLDVFEELKAVLNIDNDKIAYMGDDYPDLPVMMSVKFPITTPSAPKIVKDIAVYTTINEGGNGAVREVVEIILDENNIKSAEEILSLMYRD